MDAPTERTINNKGKYPVIENKMSTFKITVEPYAGTNIKTACIEAVETAKRLDLDVEFNFNGVTCIARPETFPDDLVSRYHEALKSKQPYKLAFG